MAFPHDAVTEIVLWFFLTVPWVGMQCVIVVYPDHAHFLSEHSLVYAFTLRILSKFGSSMSHLPHKD